MHLIPIADTATGPSTRFTGNVYVTPLSTPTAPSYLSAGIVHFAPGARTNWHVHPTGQTLHVVEGIALVGTRDGEVLAAHPGETVHCDPGIDHWHGATTTSLAVHIAIVVADPNHPGTDWFEAVTDDAYTTAQDAAR